MNKIEITHNPFIVETTFLVNGQPPSSSCTLAGHKESRLQRWVESLFDELSELFNGDDNYHIIFKGVESDFLDIQEAAQAAQDNGMHVQLEWIETRPTEQRLEDIRILMDETRKQNPKFGRFIDESEDIRNGFTEAFNKDFDVYVIATMSSGKSTLINAMLGCDLLPAANEATTATIARITDNDKLAGQFKAKRYNLNNELVDENDHVSSELLKEWNLLEDTKLIDIEGNIIAINERDEVRLVLTDTPGPNNSQNAEHQRTTMSHIQDTIRNPLILYVLNASQLGTQDDQNLLRLVADNMRKGGKQSKDRFIFVVNKMDVFDPENGEDIPSVLERVRQYLMNNGIESPQIYPVSANLTRLIRKPSDKHTRNERGEFNRMADLFGEEPSMNMLQYMPITSRVQRALGEKEYSALKLGSGLPAVEAMIDEYIDKYNLPHRLKRAYDAMVLAVDKGLNEAELNEQLDKDEAVLSQINEEVKGLQERQEKGFDSVAYKAKIEREGKNLPPKIEESLKTLEGEKNKRIREIEKPFKSKGDVSKVDAQALIKAAEKNLQFNHRELVNEYENLFEHTQVLIREDLKQEYHRYIESLFESSKQLNLPFLEGVRKAVGDISFNLSLAENEVHKKNVVVGKRTVSVSRWYKPWSWGKSETVNVYEEQDFVDLEALWKERAVSIENAFNALVSNARKQIKDGQESLVKQYVSFMSSEFEREFNKLMDSLKEKLEDQEKREDAIAEAKQQREQIQELKRQLDAILAI